MREKHILRIALLVFFSFGSSLFTNSAKAQNLDSLFTVWQDNSLEDTVRLKALYRYSFSKYVDAQPDSMIFLFNESLDMAEKASNKKVLGLMYNILGTAFRGKSEFLNALQAFD
jgi:hypothetical protein